MCALEKLVAWWGGATCKQTVPTRTQTLGLPCAEAASRGDSLTASMLDIMTLTLTEIWVWILTLLVTVSLSVPVCGARGEGADV